MAERTPGAAGARVDRDGVGVRALSGSPRGACPGEVDAGKNRVISVGKREVWPRFAGSQVGENAAVNLKTSLLALPGVYKWGKMMYNVGTCGVEW